MTCAVEIDLSSPRDMVLTRVLDAPRALVWQCWTDPAHLAHWWGPDGMANEIVQILEAGGHQSITMIDADGNRYPFHYHLTEVVEGERLSGHIGAPDHPNAEVISGIVMTVTFADAGPGRTLLTVRQQFATRSARDANVDMGARQGWGQSFEKLAALLKSLQSFG